MDNEMERAWKRKQSVVALTSTNYPSVRALVSFDIIDSKTTEVKTKASLGSLHSAAQRFDSREMCEKRGILI